MIRCYDLSQRFVGRRLFKAIDLDMPEAERKEFLDAARAVVVRGGFMPEYYFIEDRASDVPYYGYYTPEGVEPRTRIYVEDGYARPRLREISEVSEAVRGLGRGYELHRICFPAEVKDEVYRLYHSAAPALAPPRLPAIRDAGNRIVDSLSLTVLPTSVYATFIRVALPAAARVVGYLSIPANPSGSHRSRECADWFTRRRSNPENTAPARS